MIINYIYKLLNATIGSNLDALLAGKTPKTNPIELEINNVDNIVVIPTDAGRGVITPKRNAPLFHKGLKAVGLTLYSLIKYFYSLFWTTNFISNISSKH